MGKFIAFEGNNGVGKSTQIQLLKSRLEAEGRSVVVIESIGTGPLGQLLRPVVRGREIPLTNDQLILLFLAARLEAQKGIEQELAHGAYVLTDRWTLTTVVYQAKENPVKQNDVLRISNMVGIRPPDMMFLLQLDARTAIARSRLAESQPDRYEANVADAYDRERLYANLFDQYGARVSERRHKLAVSDAETQEALAARIWEYVSPTLNR